MSNNVSTEKQKNKLSVSNDESVEKYTSETKVSKRAYTEKETARYAGVSVSYLRQSRMNGKREGHCRPPPHIHLGRRVRYLKDDIDKWLESFKTSPTLL
jgi:predicted DNA-binding transcriptional regulator AlpA